MYHSEQLGRYDFFPAHVVILIEGEVVEYARSSDRYTNGRTSTKVSSTYLFFNEHRPRVWLVNQRPAKGIVYYRKRETVNLYVTRVYYYYYCRDSVKAHTYYYYVQQQQQQHAHCDIIEEYSFSRKQKVGVGERHTPAVGRTDSVLLLPAFTSRTT